MVYQPYYLDQKAQNLVLRYRDKDILNESHKMRTTIVYGLERFWGEHLRLFMQAENASNPSKREEALNKGNYWKDSWQDLFEIMGDAGISIPNDSIPNEILNQEQGTTQIQAMARKLWGCDPEFPFPEENRKIALAVMTQFCDSLVWWTQRYKKASDRDNNQTEDL